MGLRCDSMVLMCWVGSFIKSKFDKMTKDPMKHQEELLNDILLAAKDTEYGKKYNFENIKSIKDFQNQVPISIYDDYFPYIKRMVEGEKNLLTTNETQHFNKTSGTIGVPKKIPCCKKNIKNFENISLYIAMQFLTKN